jgi:ABC-type multidrug transport system fused ATPase/permease subunit
MYQLIDNHTSAHYHIFLFNKRMAMRTGIAQAIFGTLLTAVVLSVQGLDPALVGFALSFMVGGSDLLEWLILKYTDTELDMNSAERIIEYARHVPFEDQTGNDVPAAWPTEGRLEVCNIVAGYAPDLLAVLKGVTFEVEPNTRVGVVGLTGSGKSSLTLALFHLLELREGVIYVDSVDIPTINLRPAQPLVHHTSGSGSVYGHDTIES